MLAIAGGLTLAAIHLEAWYYVVIIVAAVAGALAGLLRYVHHHLVKPLSVITGIRGSGDDPTADDYWLVKPFTSVSTEDRRALHQELQVLVADKDKIANALVVANRKQDRQHAATLRRLDRLDLQLHGNGGTTDTTGDRVVRVEKVLRAVLAEIHTLNGASIGELADRVEARAAREVPEEERTAAADQHYVDTLDEDETTST